MSEANKVENGYQGGPPVQRAVTPGGHPIDSSQPAFPVYHRKFANPAPLGLLAFSTTTLLLSLFNIGARGVTVPNAIIGTALGYGGTAQFIAGVWEFAAGNTFGATAFCSYGAFWWSFAITLIPWFGVESTFVNTYGGTSEFDQALGLYLVCWFIFTFVMLMASFKSSLALVLLFFFLDLTFLLLAIHFISGSADVGTAGGAFGIITAAIAFYTGAAGLLSPDTSYFMLPVMDLSRKD